MILAFDPSFTGESGGAPRYMNSPDIDTEDFQAAIDFLSVYPLSNADKISIIGICGWGDIALNTAQIDARIKVTITSTMYNMSRAAHYGYFDSYNADDIYNLKVELNKQRTIDYKNNNYALAGAFPDELPDDAVWYVKDYFAYYRNRAYHPRSLNSTKGWNQIASLSLMNTKQDEYLNEIRSAVLVIHGDKAHSCYFSKDAFKQLVGDNKKLMLIKGAVHTDLYDNLDVIPFDEIKEFINKYI